MKKKYKVIIIGAGPSGLATAINLRKLGVKDILVIEKSKFPRYKCCAGYLTNKTVNTYKKMGLDVNKCHYSLIDDFNIFYNLKERQNITNKFLYTNSNIERVELDNAFYLSAKSQGIEIIENCMIKNLDMDNYNILLTNEKKISYEYLVYADGTTGSGSKYNLIKKKNIAMQCVFESERPDSIEIHFGITKHGYGWISTYQGKTNIGITDVYKQNTDYKKILEQFASNNNLKCNIKNIRGAFTPIGIVQPIINNNIYYVGDAVGACDPLTLSGLRYGLVSGEKCAEAIARKNAKIYTKFIKNLKFKFAITRILQIVFYFPLVQFMVFEIGCRILKKFIAFVFNNFFVNKK